MRTLALLLGGLLLAAGCGGEQTARSDPGGGDARAAAESACVRLANFPYEDLGSLDRRKRALNMIGWVERGVRASIPEGEPERYRRLFAPGKKVLDTLQSLRRQVEAGKKVEFARDEASRAFWNYRDNYTLTAGDLGLERCKREQDRIDTAETEFRRAVNIICDEAVEDFEVLTADTTADQRTGLRLFTRYTERLRKPRPSPVSRPLWEQSMKRLLGVRDSLRALMNGEIGFARFERRVDASFRGARRGFRALGFDECEKLAK